MAVQFQGPSAAPTPIPQLPPMPQINLGMGGGASKQALQQLAANKMKERIEQQRAERLAEAVQEADKMLSDKGSFEIRDDVRLVDSSPMAGTTQEEFAQNLLSLYPDAGEQTIQAFTGAFFEKRPVKIWNQELIANAQRTLVAGGMNATSANQYIDRLTAGGYAGYKDLHDEQQNDALRMWEGLFKGRTAKTTINLPGKTGEPELSSLLRGVKEPYTLSMGDAQRLFGLSEERVRDTFGISHPKRGDEIRGIQLGIGGMSEAGVSLRFFSDLESQQEIAAKMTEYANTRPLQRQKLLSGLVTGGVKWDANLGQEAEAAYVGNLGSFQQMLGGGSSPAPKAPSPAPAASAPAPAAPSPEAPTIPAASEADQMQLQILQNQLQQAREMRDALQQTGQPTEKMDAFIRRLEEQVGPGGAPEEQVIEEGLQTFYNWKP